MKDDDVREVNRNIAAMNKMMSHGDVKDVSIMDMLWDGGMPSRTIENNYVNGRRMRHVDKEKLTRLLQKEARDVMMGRLETTTSPAAMIRELEERGLMMEAVQLCTGLSEESLGMLRDGRRYPYLMQSWKAVFHDLREKLDIGPAMFGTSNAIKDSDELKSLMREIYGRSGRVFTDPEDAIKYICGNGMDRGSMARLLYVGTNVLDKVIKGERMFSKTVVARINSLLREEFTI